MSEKEIQKKMTNDFAWFLCRVKRTVPTPPELERRYMAVYEVFKDVVCTKSGKALFATKHGKSAHLSCLKHIRRNCLSDIPLISYYVPLGEDKDGLMLYKCIRGTSALEGLHQKLRQLVRGFSTSPRLMKALVSSFFLRWNQKIEIEARGLHKRYDGLYDGNMLEEEIEKMARWKDCDEPHPGWIPTKNVQSTGETFGLIDPVSSSASNGNDDDAALDEEAELAVGNLLELEAGVSDNVLNSIPESSQWLATHFGRWRPSGRVKGNDEWEYFKENLPKFQRGSGNSIANEADNYSGIQFSAFADHWNEWVASLGHEKPTVTYKSASQLQDAHKSMQKRARRDSSILPHADKINNLRDSHTSSAANQPFASRFVAAENPTRARPILQTTATQTTEAYDMSMGVLSPAEFARLQGRGPPAPSRKRSAATKTKTRSNAKPRCRKCGNEWSDPKWKPLHRNNIPNSQNWDTRSQNRVLRHSVGNKVWDVCRVEEKDYQDGFPCLDGKMPPRDNKMPRVER